MHSPIISTEAIARRLDLEPETVTLEAIRDICARLSDDAASNRHTDLAAEAHEAADTIRELIAAGEPRGLADMARDIAATDALITTLEDLRESTIEAYGRHFHHTREATEALEILHAYGVRLVAADVDLRTGTRAA